MEDGIVYLHTSDRQIQTVESIFLLTKTLGEILPNKPAPILSTHDSNALPSYEVRQFVAQEDANPYSAADAFIVTSLPQKLIANFYLKFNKPARPTKLFSKKEDAVKWLKNYLK